MWTLSRTGIMGVGVTRSSQATVDAAQVRLPAALLLHVATGLLSQRGGVVGRFQQQLQRLNKFFRRVCAQQPLPRRGADRIGNC
jgi:hypothetical protein